MSKKLSKVCTECNKKLERCRAAFVDENGEIQWVCRRCWQTLDYDKYMYEHRIELSKSKETE